MPHIPESVAQFLASQRIAVAGVSRDSQQPANLIFRRLRETGHDVVPVNPNAANLEGVACFADIASVPGPVDAVMMAAHPAVGVDVVRQCADRGIKRIWFHRAVGDGSVSDAAIAEANRLGVDVVVGGCPLMYCGNVDIGHRCMCAVLRWFHRVPQ